MAESEVAPAGGAICRSMGGAQSLGSQGGELHIGRTRSGKADGSQVWERELRGSDSTPGRRPSTWRKEERNWGRVKRR